LLEIVYNTIVANNKTGGTEMARDAQGVLTGRHRAMVDAAASWLESQGVEDIEYEYKIGDRLVDIYGVLGEKIVAAECGGIYYMEKRLPEIADVVDVLYWIPVMPLIFRLVARDLDKFLDENAGILRCKRCGNEWEPRVKNPVTCPACKRRDWNEDKPAEEGRNVK
jgi:hypothetical protein